MRVLTPMRITASDGCSDAPALRRRRPQTVSCRLPAKVSATDGRGGIGKSIPPRKLPAAQSGTGKRALQIGCHPRHDATETLPRDMPPTVIDMPETADFHAAPRKDRNILDLPDFD